MFIVAEGYDKVMHTPAKGYGTITECSPEAWWAWWWSWCWWESTRSWLEIWNRLGDERDTVTDRCGSSLRTRRSRATGMEGIPVFLFYIRQILLIFEHFCNTPSFAVPSGLTHADFGRTLCKTRGHYYVTLASMPMHVSTSLLFWRGVPLVSGLARAAPSRLCTLWRAVEGAAFQSASQFWESPSHFGAVVMGSSGRWEGWGRTFPPSV